MRLLKRDLLFVIEKLVSTLEENRTEMLALYLRPPASQVQVKQKFQANKNQEHGWNPFYVFLILRSFFL